MSRVVLLKYFFRLVADVCNFCTILCLQYFWMVFWASHSKRFFVMPQGRRVHIHRVRGSADSLAWVGPTPYLDLISLPMPQVILSWDWSYMAVLYSKWINLLPTPLGFYNTMKVCVCIDTKLCSKNTSLNSKNHDMYRIIVLLYCW